MKFQEALKNLLTPLQSMPALKRVFSEEKTRVSGLLLSWQVKTFKKYYKCFLLSQTQFFNSVL